MTSTRQAERPARIERRVQAFQDRVVTAAERLFAQRGVEATKIDDICEAADVAKRTLCNHFPTKAHIVQELSRRSVKEFLERIYEARDKGRTNRERLRLLFDGFARRALEMGPLHREVVGELFNVAHGTPDATRGEVGLSDGIRSLLRAGGPGQLPENTTVETFAEIVLGSIYVSMLEWIHRDDYDLETHIGRICEYLVNQLPGESRENQERVDERIQG